MIIFPNLVHEYLKLSAARFPDKTALIVGEERLSYRELDDRSDSLAGLLANYGIGRHDRVIVFLDNSLESVISLYGILKAGGIFVILNGTIKSKKLAYILKDSAASAIITHTIKGEVIREAIGYSGVKPLIIWVGNPISIPPNLPSRSLPWNVVLESRQGASLNDSRGNGSIDQDLAALIYTSGSTGESKGVMCSHHNILAAARSIISYIENRDDDIIVDVLPLSFDYGLYQVIMSVMFGGTVLFESFLFPVKVLQSIEREKVTGFPLVPTMAAFLLKIQNLEKYNITSLRYMTNTGAALPVDHIRRLRILFPKVKIFSMFGLTECKRVSYLPPEELDRRPASVGKAIPNCEVFLIDEQGREVAPSEVGELVIRGSNVMRGYWNAPELTSRTFRQGQFPGERLLYSGDYFRKDEDGFLYFLGRKDDMIKTKGERVSPKEVENTLSEMKGVIEVAVIGVPDDILGQAIKVFLACCPDAGVTVRNVMKFSADRMESFMIPKYVEFLDELPKTSNGKVDKSALKNRDPIKHI